MTHSPKLDTLARWATGERFAPLPIREGSLAPAISFEFFPPKTPALETQLWACIERLATLRGALDGVTIACWLLGTARGSPGELCELHGTRLEFFLTQAIDTTVRGIVYEAQGRADVQGALTAGEQLTRRMCELNQIPLLSLRADPAENDSWVAAARAGIDQLLGL